MLFFMILNKIPNVQYFYFDLKSFFKNNNKKELNNYF